MELYKKINTIRKLKGMTVDELCEKSGIPKGTLSKITAGITKDPKIETVMAIARTLDFTLEEIDRFGTESDTTIDEKKIIELIKKLSVNGRELVIDFAQKIFDYEEKMYKEIDNTYSEFSSEMSILKFPLPYYDIPASAGIGQPLDCSTCEIIELESEPPKGTDFIVRVSGDSMEPTFYDGDRLFISKNTELNYGEIGIFYLPQGGVFVKEYGKQGLISHNKNFSLIKCDGDCKCLGKVLGKVEEE